jgi:site-specific recombinase XerC
VRAVQRGHIEDWLIGLEANGNSPSTVATRYRCLQQLWRWLLDEEEIDTSPMARMKPPAIPESVTPVLTGDEMRRLFAACSGKTFDQRRDLALLTVFVDTGARLAEMAGADLEDLDLDTCTLTVTGKGTRTRRVHFGPSTATHLDRYLRLRASHPRADSEALWLGSRGRLASVAIARMVDRRGAQAGVKGVHPHSFRHTFAHEYRSAGGSEGDLMILGGWRSRTMIDRYGRSAAADWAARNYDKLSPVERLTSAD